MLRDSQLRISRSWWQIQDENVETTPFDFMEKLLNGLHHHGTSPYNWRILADKITHRHCLDTIVCQRNQLVV